MQDIVALMPFAAHVGIHTELATKGRVVLTLDHRRDVTTAGGGMHGGALMTLTDCAGAAVAYLNLPTGATTTTTAAATNFLRAATAGAVTATAEPLKVGRTVIVVATTVRDADGQLIATTTATQQVLPAR